MNIQPLTVCVTQLLLRWRWCCYEGFEDVIITETMMATLEHVCIWCCCWFLQLSNIEVSCFLFLLFFFWHITVGRHMTGSVWTSLHLPSKHIPLFTALQRNREDGMSEKRDRFQYQPGIWLLRLDRIMPYRQSLRNLPLMKYDVCNQGAAFHSAACNYILG